MRLGLTSLVTRFLSADLIEVKILRSLAEVLDC